MSPVSVADEVDSPSACLCSDQGGDSICHGVVDPMQAQLVGLHWGGWC